MAASVRAVASNLEDSNSTSITITKPTGTASGDVLVAVIMVDDESSLDTTPTPPDEDWHFGGKSQIGSTTTGAGLVWWWKNAGGSEPTNYTVSDMSPGCESVGAIWAIQGADTIIGASAFGSGTSNSSSHNMPSVTPQADGGIFVCAYCTDGDTTGGAWTGDDNDRGETASGGVHSGGGADVAHTGSDVTISKAFTSTGEAYSILKLEVPDSGSQTHASVRAVNHTTVALNDTEITLTKPTGTVDNDVLVVILTFESPAQATEAAAPGGGGWTKGGTVTEGSPGTGSGLAWFYKVASSEGADYTFTWTTSDQADGHIWAIQNADTSDPIGTVGTGSGSTTGTSSDLPTYTMDGNSGIVIMGAATDGGAQDPGSSVAGPEVTDRGFFDFSSSSGWYGDAPNGETAQTYTITWSDTNESYSLVSIPINSSTGDPPETASPPQGNLTLSSAAPTLSLTENRDISPGQGDLVLSGQTPNASVLESGVDHDVCVARGNLHLSGYMPDRDVSAAGSSLEYSIYKEATGGEVFSTSDLELGYDTTSGEDTNVSTISGTNINLEQTGHYLVIANEMIDDQSGSNRSLVSMNLRLDSTELPYWSASYIRRSGGAEELMVNVMAIIEATADQDLSVVARHEDTNSALCDRGGSASQFGESLGGLQLVKLDDDWNYFRAHRNGAWEPATANTYDQVDWDTQDEYDTAGFTHDTGTNPDQITLDNGGHYLVTYNVYGNFGTGRNEFTARLTLGGAPINGTYVSGYDRHSNGANEDGCCFIGIIEASASDILRLEVLTGSTAGAGVIADRTAITIVELPDADYLRLVEDAEFDWRAASDLVVPWTVEDEKDTGTFTHSNVTNSSRIEVEEDGTYLFTCALNQTTIPASGNLRDTALCEWRVDGTTVQDYGGFGVYVRGHSSGGDKAGSSGAIVLSLTANQYVEVVVTDTAAQAGEGVFDANEMGLTAVRLEDLFTGGASNNHEIDVSVGYLYLDGYDPCVEATTSAISGEEITPPQGNLTLTTFVPGETHTDNVLRFPAQSNLVLSSIAPTADATEGNTIEVSQGNLVLDTSTASYHFGTFPPQGNLTFSTVAPNADVDAGVARNPGQGNLVLSGQLPTETHTENVIRLPAQTDLTLGGFAPAIQAGDYELNWVIFDGSNDYLKHTGDLTGVTDSAKFTVSFWVNFTNLDVFQEIFTAGAGKIGFSFNDIGGAVCYAKGSEGGGNQVFLAPAPGGGWQTDTDYHVLWSTDRSSGILQSAVYINGTKATSGSISTSGTFDTAHNENDWIGANNSDTNLLDACLTDFYYAIDKAFVDSSGDISTADVEQFYNSGAVNPGSDGSGYTGTQPIVFFGGSHEASDWNDGTNLGTGGDYTMTGSVTDHLVPVDLTPAAGALLLSTVAPTLSNPVAIDPSVGNLLLSTTVPTVGESDFQLFDVPQGDLTLDGKAPTQDLGFYPAVGDLVLSGAAPTVGESDFQTINVPGGDLTLSTVAPIVGESAFQTFSIPQADLTLTGGDLSLGFGFEVSSGELTLSTGAPNVSDLHVALPGTADLVLSGSGLSLDFGFSPMGSDLILSSEAPSVTDLRVAFPGAGDLTLSTAALAQDLGFNPSQGDLVLSTAAPTLDADQSVALDPPSGDLVLDSQAPTLVSGNVAFPGAGDLVLSTAAVVQDLGVTPAQADLELTSAAPTLTTGLSEFPGAGSLTLSTFAVSFDVGFYPSSGDLTLSTFAPSLTGGNSATPDAGNLTLDGKAPTQGLETFPGAGQLLLTGYAPADITELELLPGAGDLVLSSASVGQDLGFHLVQNTLLLSTDAPSLTTGLFEFPGAGQLLLSAEAPTVSDLHVAFPDNADLILDTQAPDVTSDEGVARTVPGATLDLTTDAPTQDLGFNPASNDLILDGQAPISSQGIIENPGSGDLTLTTFVPDEVDTYSLNYVCFDTNDYLRTSGLDNNVNTTDITISFWIKPLNDGTTRRILTHGTGATPRVELYLQSDNEMRITLRNSIGTTIFNLNPNFDFLEGAEHHVLISIDTTLSRGACYVDGSKEASTTGSGTVNTAIDDLYIGHDSNNTGENFAGQLADFWYTIDESFVDIGGNISAADVAQFYNSGPVNPGPDGAYYTGTQPIVFFGFDQLAADWNDGTNLGDGGDFTLNVGTILDECPYVLEIPVADLVLSTEPPLLDTGNNVTRQPGQGELTLDGSAPSYHFATFPGSNDLLLSGNTLTVGFGYHPAQTDLTLSTLAPDLISEATRFPGAGNLVFTTDAPQQALNVPVTSVNLVLDTQTPDVDAGFGTSRTPPAADLTLATAAITQNLGYIPESADLVLTTEAPIMRVAFHRFPPVGALTLSGFQPTFLAEQNQIFVVPLGDLLLTTEAPLVATGDNQVIGVPATDLVLSTTVPSFSQTESIVAEIPQGNLDLTTDVPVIAEGNFVVRSVPAADLTLTSVQPTVQSTLKVLRTIPGANLALTGTASVVSVSAKAQFIIPPGALDLTTAAPTASATLSVEIPAAALDLSSLAPTADATAKVSLSVPVADLLLSSGTPAVVRTLNFTVEIPEANLVLDAIAPVIIRTGLADVVEIILLDGVFKLTDDLSGIFRGACEFTGLFQGPSGLSGVFDEDCDFTVIFDDEEDLDGSSG